MAYKKPLVLTSSGVLQQLQTGDVPITGQHVIDALGYTPSAGGGSGGNGVITVDFSTVGMNSLDVVITGLAGIGAASLPFARFELSPTADHSISDHTFAAAFCGITCGNIIVGTGFTMYLRTIHKLTKTFNVRWQY